MKDELKHLPKKAPETDVLRRMLNTPPNPHKPPKPDKPKASKKKPA